MSIGTMTRALNHNNYNVKTMENLTVYALIEM